MRATNAIVLWTLLLGAGAAAAQSQTTWTPAPATVGTPTPTVKLASMETPTQPAEATLERPVCCMNECESTGEGRLWFIGESLLWWMKDSKAPTLVTTGSSTASSAGALGQPSTQILDDGRGLAGGERTGGRFTIGYWFNDDAVCGVEASYFFLGTHAHNYTLSSPGNPIIARPFFNTDTGLQDSEVVTFPGGVSGRIDVSSSSRLTGSEANGLWNMCNACNYRIDVLAGFRYLNLEEDLHIVETINVGPTFPLFPNTNIGVADQFDTRNEFYGGQIGARGEYRIGKLILTATGKLAFGTMDESVRINGFTNTTSAGVATTAVGGLLAQRSNIGTFTKHAFAVVPEGTLGLGYQVTDHIRAGVGYNFLYASSVVRPGDQVDSNLSVRQVPTNTVTFPPTTGPLYPRPIIKETDFWAQGVTFSLQFIY